ncbi:Protein of unknown function [Salinibacillus kushneri]|uniref:DUF2922 domain-containing protein n=1 Tax=Salinibacillus kushneri TaxID=237682 RepID=A0A1I0I886_9BACI|nr:DUF2922 domain-containing protein [Salinibacillus kushneri]SET92930.1 Protein of unknown function [Salinibacillus kushneri]
MAKKLELKFANEEGKTVTFSLDEPVEPVDTDLINQAMDEIVTQNAFTSSGGDIIEKKSARIVERNVQEIEI